MAKKKQLRFDLILKEVDDQARQSFDAYCEAQDEESMAHALGFFRYDAPESPWEPCY